MTAPVGHTCKALRSHAWDFTTVTEDGRYYLQHLICLRCGTKRTWRVHKTTGYPSGNAYVYVSGYLVKGGMDPKDRGRLRLAKIRRHLRGED